MPRHDWRDDEYDRTRRMHERSRDDFGQADYSNLYGYDPRTRSGYRAFDDGRPAEEMTWEERRLREEERARRAEAEALDDRNGYRRARRDGPSDRVLWAIVMERLEAERGLDLRHVEVEVHDAEVTLNGTIRHKRDKRRIEDIADIEGVRNVQNNLRLRERDRHWTFL